MPRIKNSEHRQTFFNYKSKKQQAECFQCDESDYSQIEYHHLCYDDGEEKKLTDKHASVSDMVRENYSWEDVEAEMNKCIPLCRSCHQDYHKKLRANGYE